MEEQNRQTEQIERYLNGALSEPERKDFEAAVAGDETLRREVALHRELMETLVASIRQDPRFEELRN